MKKLLLMVAMVLTLSLGFGIPVVLADLQATFEWDANSEVDLAGYRLYQRNASVLALDVDEDGYITLEELLTGSDNTVKITDIPAGTETITMPIGDGLWYWVLTAYDTSNNESDPSNEITETIDAPPANPVNLTIKIGTTTIKVIVK